MDEKDRDGYGGGERGRDRGEENYQRSYGGGRHHEEGNSTNGQDVRTHLFIFLFLCFFTLFFHGFTSDYFVKLYKFESLIMIVNFSLTSSIIFSLLFSLFLFFSLSLSLPPCLFKTQERRALQQLMRGLSDADAEIDAERRRKRSQGASPRYVLCLTN